jgi:YesN/AraC family two-component response regulator
MIKILIADDHPVVRKGLKEIIEEAPDMIVGGEASNGGEVLEYVRLHFTRRSSDAKRRR